MIELEDIQKIVLRTVKLLKKGFVKVDPSNHDVVLKKVAFNPTYLMSMKLWHDISVHSEGQRFPASLFKEKAPNEDDQTYKYREASYQPVTQSDWDRGIINYDRVFNPQNYSIDWGEDEYFIKDYPPEGNIMSHFKSVVKDKKLEDPNAVMALMIENNEAADNVERKPFGAIFHTTQVLYDEKDFLFLMSNEKTEVLYARIKSKVGFVFYLYDDTKIWKISQKGDFVDYDFEIEEYFNHDFGYIPAQKLKGKIFKKGEIIYYKSHVNSAVYPLNYIAYDNSTLQASKVAHAYLEKWEIESECQADDCVDGMCSVEDEDIDGNTEIIKQTCRVCEGTNKANKKGVLGVKTIISRTGEDTDSNLIPPMGYVDKNPDILKLLREEIQSNQKDSFAFIGVDISNSDVKGSETALGKIIDREALENALLLFSNEIYDLLKFNIKFVNDARRKFGVNEEDPDIKEPINFTIRTEKDLTEEMKEASNLPDVYQVAILKQLINIRFGNKKLLKRIVELKQKIDILFVLNNEQAGLKVAQGFAAKWEGRLHTAFDTYISQEIENDEKFLDKEDKEIAEILIAKAKEQTPAAPGKVEDIIKPLE